MDKTGSRRQSACIRVIRQNNPINVAIRICSLPVRNFAGRDSESSFSVSPVPNCSFSGSKPGPASSAES